ncbi:MAG TPA: FecR family protein, partial [Candidatus Udaeobacter sp.]|nr:FecR family protein [Candidatus Udaeobacter sp.]
MANVAVKTPPKRRNGLRLLVILVILAVIIGGALVWVNIAAQAAVNVTGTLTVYQQATSVAHGSSANFVAAKTGDGVQAGDSIQTDARGRAGVTLPDGTLTRLAGNTTIRLDAAHFTKNGNLHDVKFTQQIGRTLTNVQHLVSGSTFDVAGAHATATVRGTRFEVYIKSDGSMTVKVFDGTVILHNGSGSVTINKNQQATANPDGSLTEPIPIQPDPDDPFGPAVLASAAVEIGTTPGTEQDFIGAPIHNGEQQQYAYSYAGGNLVKASLGYPGSAMKLTIKAPDGQLYFGTGTPPVTVVVNNAPAGIYTLVVDGVSGLGSSGEEPFLAVASVEPCATADVESGGAIHRGYTAQDL